MGGYSRSVLHRDRGFCADAGSSLLGQAPSELGEKELLIGLRLGVASEEQLASVGGREMHVEELHGGELLEDYSRGEAGRALLEQQAEPPLPEGAPRGVAPPRNGYSLRRRPVSETLRAFILNSYKAAHV